MNKRVCDVHLDFIYIYTHIHIHTRQSVYTHRKIEKKTEKSFLILFLQANRYNLSISNEITN